MKHEALIEVSRWENANGLVWFGLGRQCLLSVVYVRESVPKGSSERPESNW